MSNSKNKLYCCVCAQFHKSHSPECPAKMQYETLLDENEWLWDMLDKISGFDDMQSEGYFDLIASAREALRERAYDD